MADRSCFEIEDKKFCDSLINSFVRGGTYAAIFFTTFYLIDKTIKHSCRIKELSLRLEECEEKHESSQDHELKK